MHSFRNRLEKLIQGSVSKAHTYKFYIFNNVCIFYIYQVILKKTLNFQCQNLKKNKTALVVMFQQLIFEQVFVLLISASAYDILEKNKDNDLQCM